MKKKTKIKIPAAVFGIQTGDALNIRAGKIAGGIGDSIGNIGSLVSSFTGTSGARTTGDVTKESLMGVASGIGAGAKIGSSRGGGPWGAAIGAVGGAILGGIGKKGKAAEMTSFTDYDEGTLSTGLRAIGSNGKLKRERTRIRQNAYNNRAAIQGTEALASEYAEEYGDMDTNTFAFGGASPMSLAYVDDGELVQTPDGKVSQVPEQGQPTDSNLVNLPGGSRVLSNTLKVPGTKQTFSELGESMMAKKKSKGNDRFASNASKLNEMNNKAIHDRLFNIQEQLKYSKGIKNKDKSFDAEHFAKGGRKAPVGYYNYGLEEDNVLSKNSLIGDTDRFGEARGFGNTSMNKVKYGTNISSSRQKELVDADAALTKRYNAEVAQDKAEVNQNLLGNLGKIGTGLATMAPMFSNMMTKDDAPVQANYNPYAGTIAKTMRGRRFDIDPALQDVSRNRAISNYNAGQMNTNTGANLAYRLQTALGEDRAVSALRSQQSNVQNQYSADYTNTLNSLGQQWAGATNLASDLNAQNRATTRNIRRTGMGQLSQYMQNQQLMSNQASRDDAMMQLYGPFLQAGFSQTDLAGLQKYLKRGGNRVG